MAVERTCVSCRKNVYPDVQASAKSPQSRATSELIAVPSPELGSSLTDWVGTGCGELWSSASNRMNVAIRCGVENVLPQFFDLTT